MTDIDDKELDALSENAIGLCEDVRQRAIKSENEEVKYDTGDKHLDYEAARAFSDLAAAITALRARLAEAERERDRLRSALDARWAADIKAARAIMQAKGFTQGFPSVKEVVAYYIEQCESADAERDQWRARAETARAAMDADFARDIQINVPLPQKLAAVEAQAAKMREALTRIVKADEARDAISCRYANSIITGSDPSAYERYMAADTEFWDAIDAARAAAQEGGE